MMKLAAAPKTDLAGEVATLRSQLATAEAANVNPQAIAIESIRAELNRRLAVLDANEAAKADAQRQALAADALRLAERDREKAESELNRLCAIQRSLPDALATARLRFGAALSDRAKASSAVAALERKS